ncbi:MAG: hypothetical protein ACR2PI_20115 [Hyphomicrobiaceae bacterium]
MRQSTLIDLAQQVTSHFDAATIARADALTTDPAISIATKGG